jgi:putative oxidoreductase
VKKLLLHSINPTVSLQRFNLAMLFFRVFVSLEMLIVHGLKKLGIGVAQAENIPNPFNLPQVLNTVFALSANIVFPFLVIIGFCTRIATLPSLAVTLTGYFVVHRSDTLLEKDIPFMYSVCYLLILLLGPGKYSVDNAITKKSAL